MSLQYDKSVESNYLPLIANGILVAFCVPFVAIPESDRRLAGRVIGNGTLF